MKKLIGILAFVWFSACTDSTAPHSRLTIPDDGGSAQTGVIGERVATAPTVLVTDGRNPVAGVEVSFAVTSGGGSVSSATQMTDASGLASVGWTLGRTFGKNELSATVAGLPPVTFTAMAIAPDTGIVAFDLIDPLGDTLPQSDNTLPPAIDLLSLRGAFRSSDLILTATFSAPVSSNSPAPDFVRGLILFDTDDNPNTREYELDLAGTQTVIRGSSSTLLETSFKGSTLVITIPMSALGYDDGNFNFTGTFGPADRESDRFPNNGTFAVRLGPDVQAVAGFSQTGVMGEPTFR
ncbi:MAG: hypothetical protein M3P12_12030 [Gemmatimonadota bacterium]|nr:hypothetical protein [Gemmatimonadota bacterium]